MNHPAVRTAIETAFTAALAAVEPAAATRNALTDRLTGLRVGLVAIGKAADAMLTGALAALGDAAVSGVVVSHHPVTAPERFSTLIAAHPIPDESSVVAGTAVVDYLDSADVEGIVFLISGGASALVEVPPPGFSITELGEINRRMMGAGIPIEAMNLVRSSLSMIKNGGLLRHIKVPALTLLISDVGNNPATTIGSGLTIAAPQEPEAVLEILRQVEIEADPRIETYLRKHTEPAPSADWEVISDGGTAAAAAIRSLEAAGHIVHRAPRPFFGEARRAATSMVRGAEPGFTVVAGEATVTVTGTGRGGRNTEAALAVAINIEDCNDVVFAALATDGRDGETDCAGAIVDGATIGRVQAAGIDPVAALLNNDSYPTLDASNDVLRTGSTGTNVADLWITWRAGPPQQT